ncbi:RIP metalloprotease RseP [Rhodoferax sp.]|uniref:RIP metalloprotease RseP n=1 Tax=Rhodoferax sp. TaxID=50421 RepID=UPI0028425793|nr:RIP metalloprotease RseP [Rhodoferax sp.]MDR3369737.1 RIP metalloprotease RseP [Rhodoferax sp.]
MLTLPAFIVAIALLIAIHEYGHYRMAVACGVKVLRFSIGFGKPLLHWQAHPDTTEFVLSIFPVGGYVKMLDEREGPVEPAQRHMAFNNQTLPRRAAIVVAGPTANLLLAVFLYAVVNWMGVVVPEAILSPPPASSLANQAGLTGGERVLRMGIPGSEMASVASFEEVRWLLTQGALGGDDVSLVVAKPDHSEHEVLLALSTLDTTQVDAELFNRIGIVAPLTRPTIGELQPDGAAAQAGLREGDEVQSVDDQPMQDGQQLRQFIRSSVAKGQVQPQRWTVLRGGQLLTLSVTPKVVTDNGVEVGRIGAFVGSRPAMTTVTYGPVKGIWRGVTQTWDISAMTLKMMGKMLVGQASLKNISGPLTIADFAGKSAGMGVIQYLTFLALVSVSLGVLNLLPLPVLDGGHLMYYLWEGVTGKPVSERWMEHLQQGGIALLMVMMFIALFNDITRLLG